jgi:pSer/pThr/pTyr-binding forkhead associated (FHA) protein
MAKLIVQHKNRDAQLFHLHKREVIIGRGENTDLLLPDVSVSRRHCSVRQTSDG